MITLRNYTACVFKAWLMGMVLIAAGCETPQKIAVPEEKQSYELKHETRTLTLVFPKHQAKLPHEEKIRLLSALRPVEFENQRIKSSTHVTLPRIHTALGKQRLKSIVRTLLKAGIKPKQIHRSQEENTIRVNELNLKIDIYMAIPPLCPNWSTSYGSSYSRGPTSNFGCSTAANFLLMIDDPIVLFRGEKPLTQDAARDSLAISDFRAGKDKGKWLRVEKSDGGSGGSSGGSGGGSGGGGS